MDQTLHVLDEALDALQVGGIECLVMGGIASAALGRNRWTHDIDLFVRREEAAAALSALAKAGFRTERTDPSWLFKGFKLGEMVDLIFWTEGVVLDEVMLARAPTRTFDGRELRVVPPEDLLVIKTLAHKEETPRHWYDALGLIENCDLDWDYLARRATGRERRVLSLLIYAQSEGLAVPDPAVRALFERTYPAP